MADWQKIAMCLSRSIIKETATARNILDNYNSILSTIGDETCSLQDALCPDSKFWEQNQQLNIPMTWSTKKDIIQEHLLLKGSEEKLALLEKERLNTLNYWLKLKSAINMHLLSLERCDKYSIGVIALLKTCLSNAEYYHSACKAELSTMDHDDDDSNNEESCHINSRQFDEHLPLRIM